MFYIRMHKKVICLFYFPQYRNRKKAMMPRVENDKNSFLLSVSTEKREVFSRYSFSAFETMFAHFKITSSHKKKAMIRSISKNQSGFSVLLVIKYIARKRIVQSTAHVKEIGSASRKSFRHNCIMRPLRIETTKGIYTTATDKKAEIKTSIAQTT